MQIQSDVCIQSSKTVTVGLMSKLNTTDKICTQNSVANYTELHVSTHCASLRTLNRQLPPVESLGTHLAPLAVSSVF